LSERPRPKVLVVEDDDNDILFLQRALSGCGAELDLDIARDGESAIQRLSQGNLPDRILLDLKLPRRSGLEVLAWIRSTPALKHLSVTVMTSSGEPSDLSRIQELGIEEYVVKPVSYQALLEIVRTLCRNWNVPMKTPA
jgi:CheY-like chemotaxis protein